MPIIENFATVRYTSGGTAATRVSNVAQSELTSSVTFGKATLGDRYDGDSTVTYILTISNTSTATINAVTVRDDLGSFVLNETTYTPLTYVGPAVLLVDGQDVTPNLTVDISTPGTLIFSFPALAAGATANIIYTADVNGFAPLDVNSTITNTATITAEADCVDGTASATITVTPAADVSIFKQMTPNPVICGDTVTYTIRIFNYGNIPAEDVQLVDAFDPAPTNITVSRNGILLPAIAYTYEGGVLTVPSGTDLDTVPAATYTRDAVTGEVIVTPGMLEYVITGTI